MSTVTITFVKVRKEHPGKVKAKSMQGQGKVKLSQGMVNKKHNHKCNYNLMGFDTIEINLEENKLGLSWAQVLKFPGPLILLPPSKLGTREPGLFFLRTTSCSERCKCEKNQSKQENQSK